MSPRSGVQCKCCHVAADMEPTLASARRSSYARKGPSSSTARACGTAQVCRRAKRAQRVPAHSRPPAVRRSAQEPPWGWVSSLRCGHASFPVATKVVEHVCAPPLASVTNYGPLQQRRRQARAQTTDTVIVFHVIVVHHVEEADQCSRALDTE